MNVQSAISALAFSSKRKFAKWVLFGYFTIFNYAICVIILLIIVNDVVKSVLFPTKKAIVQFIAYYAAFLCAFTVSDLCLFLTPVSRVKQIASYKPENNCVQANPLD